MPAASPRYWYRPARELTPDRVAGLVERGLCATGYEEVGLLSLSAGDYSSIGPLLVRLMDAHAEQRVSVSLPSLRVDSLDPRLLDEVSRVRKTGFTIAPEAGTDRLRRVVNKNITEADILGAVDRIFGAGWKAVKLYFMVGLPTETREDWAGIVDLVHRVARQAPSGRGRVGVSLFTGRTGPAFYVTAPSVGGIVCIASSNGRTTSQDLKTGFLVGATPRYQQIAILIGAAASALLLGPILLGLNNAATVYVPAFQVAPGLRAPPDAAFVKTERLRGPQAVSDHKVYRVWHKTDAPTGAAVATEGSSAPLGRYLVDDSGAAVWLVDPGINGAHHVRPDGT